MKSISFIKYFLVFVFLVGAHFISSNSELPQDKDFEISFKLGMKYIDGEMWEEALEVFKELLAKDEYNANVNYLVGYCYFNIPARRSQAISYFENAVNDVSGNYRPDDYTEISSPAIAYFYLAEIYYLNHEFDAAMNNYEALKLLVEYAEINLMNYNKAELIEMIDLKMEKCNFAISLSQNPVKVDIIDIPLLNHPEYSTYAGFYSDNELWFSKNELKTGSTISGDIYLVNKKNNTWDEAVKVKGDINSDSDEIFCGVAQDGEMLLFASDRNERKDYDIFYSRKGAKKWSEPKNNLSINSSSNETFASYSMDGNSICFVSDRPGGMGGKDLYKSVKQSDGSWGKAENMGDVINTRFDEESPCFAADGMTLYFSSRGHDNMGGYDIFYSLFRNGEWTKPVNIGFPINSALDDIYFYRDTSDICIYSSERKDSPGGFYLFMMKIIEERQLQEAAAVVEENVDVDVEERQRQEAAAVVEENVDVDVDVDVDVEERQLQEAAAVVEQIAEVDVEERQLQEAAAVVEEKAEADVDVRQEQEAAAVVEATDVKPVETISYVEKYYTVQIGAGNMLVKYFDKIKEKVVCFGPDGLARFYVGAFNTLAEAVRYRDELVLKGYSDAWTPKIDEMRCEDFDLYDLLNVDDKGSGSLQKPANYTVQVGAGNMKIEYFRKLQKIKLCRGTDGLIRFIFGEYSTRAEAGRVKDAVIALGYYDAWIPEIDADRCGE